MAGARRSGGASNSGTIRVGVGGWTYEPWRGRFYPDKLPQKRELEYASNRLSSIEINGTFYGSQKPESFAKWFDETPDDFVFAVKAPRFATNRKLLASAGKSIQRFCNGGLLELKHKLGPINWQFMPTKVIDGGDFEAFLKLLPTAVGGTKLRHAVEVRHESFATPEFVALAKQYGVAIVLAGDLEYPLIPDVTASFVYVRLMGTKETAKLGYLPKTLDQWADRARIWASGDTPEDLAPVDKNPPERVKRDVYIYVISGYKAANPDAAMALRKRVG